MKYVDVILPLPLDGTFTYSVPDGMEGNVVPGVRLLVPLGKSKKYIAMATRLHDDKPAFSCKPVEAVLDNTPSLLPQQMRLWQWIGYYYMAPLGDVYNAAMPGGLKSTEKFKPKMELYVELASTYRSEQALHVALNLVQRALKQAKTLTTFLSLSHWDSLDGDTPREGIKKVTKEELMNESHCTAAVVKALIDRGILFTYELEIGRLNTNGESHLDLIKPLSLAQQDAYNGILMQMMKKDVVLLHGVTSSGKTEIYIHLIRKAIEEHKQVLYLLPEIALTVQIMERLHRVFGDRLGIYHSKYSDAERVEIWQKQLSDHPYDVILGARSAVFLPFKNLGLVIIDEEHETSFKQQDPAPRYHARSAAIVLAKMYGAKTLLGTATPSMESYYNAQQGKYGLVELKTRYKGIQLPEIQVVDVKDLRRRKMMSGPFSPQLLAAVREALKNGQQAILFQNRRGFAPMVECKVCGWVPKCKNCDVSLTLHKSINLLTCHYCGCTYPVPTECPNCGSTEIMGRGFGTEKIEDQIAEIFPEAKIARMDLDTTRTRNAYERLIADFSEGRTNLLIGTQMVSKGLDFDKVSVVGILNADSMLNYPDFRAYEHAFMMMAQVSGRAGRKGKRGLVILQTKNPTLPVIGQVVNNDYEGLYQGILEERRTFHYPPFFHLINVYVKHKYDKVCEQASHELSKTLRSWFSERVLGPDKPAVARVKTMNIRKIVIKLENGIDQQKVREYLKFAQQQMGKDPRYGALQIYYDVDPL
ncbi:primosomal protein N' [Prevotella copri]|uniref:Replication restart protein PriA n=1 Tax=Segatella copri TaxID=165179 RepID=A0AB35ZFC6_9BACT|nr:primosomal protein N' [Segatella copri]MQN33390.1 primosomal protein N' [Segatella copri]MQN40869.1 primosomal protein N' [Segatella copri]MQN46350.1 primosomal protein N' [Segatella copri]MQN65493.1 primosomal protein N' [Segatella copri]MQN72288.1 primosomal protein N' [Segatella copri]